MAAVTLGVATFDSSNLESYVSDAFTPAANDLLLVLVSATNTVAAGTVTDSQGGTYTKITGAARSGGTGYAFIRNSLTYNGCAARHSWRPSFSGDTWRIFFGAPSELWSNSHDVIRLLDNEGRVVDVWSY